MADVPTHLGAYERTDDGDGQNYLADDRADERVERMVDDVAEHFSTLAKFDFKVEYGGCGGASACEPSTRWKVSARRMK
jgi:hypothetical protein